MENHVQSPSRSIHTLSFRTENLCNLEISNCHYSLKTHQIKNCKVFWKDQVLYFQDMEYLHAKKIERTQIFDYLLIHVYHLLLPPLALIIAVIQ